MMSNREVILEYRGMVTFATVDSLLGKLKAQSVFRNLSRGVQKRLYCIFVECLENIYKYESNELAYVNSSEPYIYILKKHDIFCIGSGNIILNERINGLKRRLEQINRQDHEGLKASYAAIIDQETISKEEGAGLGLITIALRSGNKINYSFTSLDPRNSYFEMKIII